MTQPIVLYAAYDKSGDAVTGLTVTVNVYRITRSTGASSQIVTGGSATEVGTGVYLYAIAAADLQLYDYVAAFATAGDVTSANVWSVYPPLANAYGTELGRLDAAVSTRLAAIDYSAAPSAADVADEVASIDPADYGVGTAGYAWAAAGSAADPLLNEVPGDYPSKSAGNALGRIASGQLTIVQPVLADGFVRIVGGSTYKATIGTAIDVSSDGGWPTIPADATIKWVFGSLEYTGSRVDADTVRLELTAAQSAALLAAYSGRRTYDITATWSTGEVFYLANEAPCLIE